MDALATEGTRAGDRPAGLGRPADRRRRSAALNRAHRRGLAARWSRPTSSRSCSRSTGRSGWSASWTTAPGADSDGRAAPRSRCSSPPAPLVGLGLLVAGPGRRWFDGAAGQPGLTRRARQTGGMSAASRPSTPRSPTLLRRDPAGLVAAVVQQHDTGEVLMVAWMDDEALHRTLTTGPGHLLVAQPRRVLGQGRDLGQPAVGARRAAGLRRRRAAGAGRPGGRRPATPASAAASTGRCPPSRGGRA